jgi:hypothetical protein
VFLFLKQYAQTWIEENKSRLVELSDAIWDYPELGLQEFKSSALLAKELETHGFTVDRGVAGMPTAFVASYGAGQPVIGILGSASYRYIRRIRCAFWALSEADSSKSAACGGSSRTWMWSQYPWNFGDGCRYRG